jgi:hypothetical protein
MSGKPLRNPTDANKYRNEYLAYLDLQIDNDEKNLQANLLHKRTGQVASQITDYSTTSQKLANMYALRIELKKQLRRICVAEDADLVVQGLRDDEVRFAVNYIEKLVAELRPKFKYGAPEPYVSQYIRRVYDIELESQGLPNENILREILGRMGQLVSRADLEDAGRLIIAISRTTNEGYLAPIQQDIADVRGMIDRIGQITSFIANKPIDPILLPEIERIVKESTADLPTKGQLTELLIRIDRAKGDTEQVKALVADLHQLLAQNPDDLELLARGLDALQASVEEQSRQSAQDVETLRQGTTRLARGVEVGIGAVREDIGELRGRQDNLAEAVALLEDRLNVKLSSQQIRVVDEMTKARATLGAILDRLAKLEEGQETKGEPVTAEVGIPAQEGLRATFPVQRRIVKKLPVPLNPKSDEYKAISRKAQIDDLTERYITILEERGVEPPNRAPSNYVANIKGWYRRNYPQIVLIYEAGIGPPPEAEAEAVGKGLRRIKGKGISIDEDLGVKSNLKFAPFGRYIINLAKLNDDIIRLCRKNGTNISNCKTLRVSPDLANVIRKIVNGGKPTFNDLTALNDEDKHKYNEYIRKSEIVGEGIEVPEIDEKKDLNQFEIMKGEILSGNDSTELIKKFKTLIVKLVHNGRLPKGQAKELLLDLASLGY